MAMVNTSIMPATVLNPNVKDSRWLTLEVCREFTRNKCTRSDTECKFAHPPPHVEVQNGRVTCCFDSIKGKCQRKDPPCKYLHPPQHLKEQLLQNGRNNLIMRNLQISAGIQAMHPGMMPVVYESNGAVNSKQSTYPHPVFPSQLAYPGSIMQPIMMNPSPGFPYIGQTMTGMIPAGLDGSSLSASMGGTGQLGGSGLIPSGSPVGGLGQGAPAQHKLSRVDRLELNSSISPVSLSNGSESPWIPSATTSDSAASLAPPTSQCSPLYFQPPMVELITSAGKKRPRDTSEDLILSMPGIMPMVKRPAVADSKSGVPMYHPVTSSSAAAYQQAAIAMQLQQQQQQFMPAVTQYSQDWASDPWLAQYMDGERGIQACYAVAGHPPGVPRF